MRGQSPDKYRPISILSNLFKLLEKIVYIKLFKYCTENNLLNSRNSGFKPRDSVVDRLVELVHNTEGGLNEKEISIVLLDISKAFNKNWHEGLLFKLKQIGIEMSLLKCTGFRMAHTVLFTCSAYRAGDGQLFNSIVYAMYSRTF